MIITSQFSYGMPGSPKLATSSFKDPASKTLSSHPTYHDYADMSDDEIAARRLDIDTTCLKKPPGDIKEMFPTKLHTMLESVSQSRHSSIVRWLPHGRAFKVYDKHLFAQEVLPHFFPEQTEFLSFQRQLNLYGLLRLTGKGSDQNAYYHPYLLRGKPNLCQLIRRREIAENNVRRRFDPKTEPDFYHMTTLPESTTTTAFTPNAPQQWQASTSPVASFHRASATLPRSRQTSAGSKTTGLSDESTVDQSSMSSLQQPCDTFRRQQFLLQEATSNTGGGTSGPQQYNPMDSDLDMSQQQSYAPQVPNMKRSRRYHEQHQQRHPTATSFGHPWNAASNVEQPRSLWASTHAAPAMMSTSQPRSSARVVVVPSERAMAPLLAPTLWSHLSEENERAATAYNSDDSSSSSNYTMRKRIRLDPMEHAAAAASPRTEAKEEAKSPPPPPQARVTNTSHSGAVLQELDVVSDSEDFPWESTGLGSTQDIDTTADWMGFVASDEFWF